MEHYFNRMQPIVLTEHNMDTLNHMMNQFVDEVRGEIEAWSERGSRWVGDEMPATIPATQPGRESDSRRLLLCICLWKRESQAARGEVECRDQELQQANLLVQPPAGS